MRWDVALDAMLAALRADADLMADLVDRKRLRQEEAGALDLPALTYLVVDGEEAENVETMLTRWSVWGTSRDQTIRMERRFRAVLVADTPIVVGGVAIWSEIQAARDLAEPGSTTRRSLDLHHEFAREA